MPRPPRATVRAATLAAGLTLGLTLGLTAAGAATLPPSGRLDFDVMRSGKDIGDHSYVFSGTPAQFQVQVVTDVHVKVPVIRANLYSFTQQSTEAWQNGRLARLTATTDDDGTPHKLSLGESAALPASLWQADTAKATALINTVDGHMMKIRVADMGNSPVPGGRESGHHYRISGDLERDVWYDADGLLSGMSLTAQDGSQVTYVRR